MNNSKKFWDKQAGQYNSNDNEETTALLRQAEKYFNSTDSVLDFACGTGDSTLGISKLVKEVKGIDISDEMIKYATIKAEKSQQNNVSFNATTIEGCSFEKGSLDVIVAFNIIHLLDNLDATMERINHLLKPEGLFISYTACLGDKQSLASRLIRFVSRFSIFPDITPYSCKALEEAICSYGFESVESSKNSSSVPNLYLVVRKG